MKIIYSYWESNKHFFCDVEMAKLSHDFAKKCGYKTCLYTDEKGLEILTHNINYDEIILFNKQILSEFPPEIWCLGKILAMSLVKEPFMHLDFDLFLIKPLESQILEKNFFSLHSEPWISNFSFFTETYKKIVNLYPQKYDINIENNFSYNFSIIGANKIYEINTVCQKIINFAICYKEDLQKIYQEIIDMPSWCLPVIFEQVLIQNMLLKIFNINIETIFPLCDIKYSNPEYEKNQKILIKEATKFLKENFIKNKIIHIHGNKIEKFNILKKFIE